MHALLLYRHVIRQSPTVPAPPSRLCTHTLADNADTSNCACTTIPFVYPHTRRHMQTHPTVPAPPSRLCTHTLADTCRHTLDCVHIPLRVLALLQPFPEGSIKSSSPTAGAEGGPGIYRRLESPGRPEGNPSRGAGSMVLLDSGDQVVGPPGSMLGDLRFSLDGR